MELSILERLSLHILLPEKGTLHQIRLRKDILQKIDLTADEIKKGNIEEHEGRFHFPKEGNFLTEIEFTEDEESLIKQGAERLNKNGEVTEGIFDLVERLI